MAAPRVAHPFRIHDVNAPVALDAQLWHPWWLAAARATGHFEVKQSTQPTGMTPYDAMHRLLDLRQRLLDTGRGGNCQADAEALGFGLRALRAVVQGIETVQGGGK